MGGSRVVWYEVMSGEGETGLAKVLRSERKAASLSTWQDLGASQGTR